VAAGHLARGRGLRRDLGFRRGATGAKTGDKDERGERKQKTDFHAAEASGNPAPKESSPERRFI
jgi:hypothetical protein